MANIRALDDRDEILLGVGGFTHEPMPKTSSRSDYGDLFAPPWQGIQDLQIKLPVDMHMVPIDRFFAEAGPWVPIGLDTYTEIFLQRKKGKGKETRSHS